jgi:hypothetical protein
VGVIWEFRYFASANAVSEIKTTYDKGSAEKRSRFLSRLKILASLPIEEWNENYRKVLRGPCAGLEEIRLKADKVQQRLLGFRSGENEFTILSWVIEKGNKFVPASACTTALERKALVLADRKRSDAIWLALE